MTSAMRPPPPLEGTRTLATSLESLHPLGRGEAADTSSVASLPLLRWSTSTLKDVVARQTTPNSLGGASHFMDTAIAAKEDGSEEEEERGLEEGIEDVASPRGLPL